MFFRDYAELEHFLDEIHIFPTETSIISKKIEIKTIIDNDLNKLGLDAMKLSACFNLARKEQIVQGDELPNECTKRKRIL